VIRWPTGVSQPAGKIIDVPTSIVDIYPTLIELAGIRYPSEFEGQPKRQPTGRSLRPLFTDEESREVVPSFQWYSFSRAWIEDEWKAVSLYGGPWQLFNLRTDRCEATDLARQLPDRVDDFVTKWHSFAVASGVPDASRRAGDIQHGWGWHRLTRAYPSLVSMSPANGATAESTKIELSLSFDQAIDFKATGGKWISLYDVSDESTPIWQSDPDESHPSQGKRTVRFDNIPTLKANSHYAIRCDAGWIKLGKRPGGAINDGAYWWRFRTPDSFQTP